MMPSRLAQRPPTPATRTVTTLELRRGDRVVLPFPTRAGTWPNVRTVNRVIDLHAEGIVGNRPLYAVWYDRHDDDACPTGNSGADTTEWTILA